MTATRPSGFAASGQFPVPVAYPCILELRGQRLYGQDNTRTANAQKHVRAVIVQHFGRKVGS
jgi:hypothetical protein